MTALTPATDGRSRDGYSCQDAIGNRVARCPVILGQTMPTPFGPLARYVVNDAGEIVTIARTSNEMPV